ncbi:MAG: SDR family NAD(P)-dependent oxidoreductase [Anaerolineae bacterium]|nr:SDR family NAD(P)-dependent oxidoreductase [Anaerolineae bacterium]
MGKFEGQVVLVTGASSGMGKATALGFAREGATVALVARRADVLQEVAAEVESLGGTALPLPTDLADGVQARAAVEKTVAAFGRLDVVVNVAGTNLKKRAIAVLDPADWDEMLATNLSAAFHTTQAALVPMRTQQSGLIIYVSTGAVQHPDTSGVAYQASKHGISGLAHGTREEEKGNGIRTCIIFPGLTKTPLLNKRPTPTPPEVVAKALLPEDVAAACLFVAGLPPRVRVPEMQILPAGL